MKYPTKEFQEMKNLETRTLGRSGLDLTIIGLGLWAAGNDEFGPTDDKDSLDTIDAALEAGVNFFDTSDIYGQGHSEKLLGRAMQGRRERFIIASKIGWDGFDHEAGHSRYTTVDAFVESVEGSLRRLKTDTIDLLQWHVDYREATMETAIEGFQKLQKAGKIRAYGVSTSDFEYLKAFNADGGCASLQIDYSILNRTPEKDIFPYCREHGIGVIIRGPLAMGILTGKFDANPSFGEGDFRHRWLDDPEENAVFLEDLQKVEQLKPLAREQTLAQLALRFAYTHPSVTTVIPGAKTVRQFKENLKAGLWGPLSAEEQKAIDAITPPGGGRKIWPA
jgi:aryl-alcohol dehydrogenase-like predicted oxidoreductase